MKIDKSDIEEIREHVSEVCWWQNCWDLEEQRDVIRKILVALGEERHTKEGRVNAVLLLFWGYCGVYDKPTDFAKVLWERSMEFHFKYFGNVKSYGGVIDDGWYYDEDDWEEVWAGMEMSSHFAFPTKGKWHIFETT